MQFRGFCKNGIKKQNLCCAKSCGSCTGQNCNKRPGGSEKCCNSGITDNGIICEKDTDDGCIIPKSKEYFHNSKVR